jgi:hypothetical protein
VAGQVFDFQSVDPLPDGPDPLSETEHGHPWIEFRIGNGSLMISKMDDESINRSATHVPWV